ncbi:hypothetical protein QQP08_008195, partial [Theobroma cacao]
MDLAFVSQDDAYEILFNGIEGGEGDQPIVEHNVLKEIKEEQEKGMLHFHMRINTKVTYQRWGLLWRGSQPGVNSYCWDLMVEFAHETGAGRLLDEGQKERRAQ